MARGLARMQSLRILNKARIRAKNKGLAAGVFALLWPGVFALLLLSCAGTPMQGEAISPDDQATSAPVDPISGDTSASSAPVALPPSEPSASTHFPARLIGRPVDVIHFSGVSAERLAPLPAQLAQQAGTPLTEEKIAQSLRQLFATGLYNTLNVHLAAESDAGGIVLEFQGEPRIFIGTVTVDGAKGVTMNGQLQQASHLSPGTRFAPAKIEHGVSLMRQVMANAGFNQSVIAYAVTPHSGDQLTDIAFHVISGVQARVGQVVVTGDAGMTVEEFRHAAHLRMGALVDRDTISRALAGVLKRYRKQDRLEAEIKLESHDYSASTHQENYHFTANRGPIVRVLVAGAKASNGVIRRAIPVFQEGAVDDDLLNEGNHNLRDYYQRQGFFSAQVDHQQPSATKEEVIIQYTVRLGQRRRVEQVDVTGNRYFSASTLKSRLSVTAANAFDRHGTYSQAMLSADIASITALYQSNGFSNIKVTPATTEQQMPVGGRQLPLKVVYLIEEGAQQRVGSLRLEGTEQIQPGQLVPMLNTAVGQPLSPENLTGDRDTLMTYYLSRGFRTARVDVANSTLSGDPTKVDVTFRIHEGRPTFVRNVLVTGLHYTRPGTIARAFTFKSGDPLDEFAIAETQRNLYDFALFNEVDTAIENPSGEETEKTVLIQTTEARRWAITYGLGFEVQTGTCGTFSSSGSTCGGANGKTGASPRVLLDITRTNLFGREQSISLRGTYGLLEQKIKLQYQIPRLRGSQYFGFDLSGGYANTQDVTTYVASKLEVNLRLNQHFRPSGQFLSRANTFVYEVAFRRVQVAANSLQVMPSEIAALSAPVRVSGPGFTWIRDTRDSPLDAHRGSYTSFQEYFSTPKFGAEAQFNRIDISNSKFFHFDKDRFVIARNTRYGQERSFGTDSQSLLPLPERLFAGGANSHRGFGSNSAGPRDPITGYPIGGAGVFVNSTEFRLPPPTFPWFGTTLSFVLFHDMGNVFTNASDIWASALRVVQPHRDSCRSMSTTFTRTATGQQGPCSFNYFDHAAGVGLRYHTPVGPIRLDFSYNINPPIYPVCTNCSSATPPVPPPAGYVGVGPHFNFFFSLGQTF